MIDLKNKNGLDLTQCNENVVNTLYNNLYSLIVQLAEQKDYEAIYWVMETMCRLPWCKERQRGQVFLRFLREWWKFMTFKDFTNIFFKDSFFSQLEKRFSDNKEVLVFLQKMRQDVNDKKQEELSTMEQTMKIIIHRKVDSETCQIEIFSANGDYFNSFDLLAHYNEDNLYRTQNIGDIRITPYVAKSFLIQCDGVTILYLNNLTYNLSPKNRFFDEMPRNLERNYDVDILIADGEMKPYKEIKQAMLADDLRERIQSVMNKYKYGIILFNNVDYHRIRVCLNVMRQQDEKRNVIVNGYTWCHYNFCKRYIYWSKTNKYVRIPNAERFIHEDEKEFYDDVLPELVKNGFAMIVQESSDFNKYNDIVSQLDMSQTVLIYLKDDCYINKDSKCFSKSLYDFIHTHNWAIEYLPVAVEWEELKKLCVDLEQRYVILPNITETDVQIEGLRWERKNPEVITQSRKITKPVGNHGIIIDIEIKD